MNTSNPKPTLREAPPSAKTPRVVVIQRRGSHVQYMKRDNIIFLPALCIREHYAELERVAPKRIG